MSRKFSLSLLLSWLRIEKSSPNRESRLDKKLLRQIKGRSWPSWTQFKYLSDFLNPTEKKATLAASIILISATLGWGAIFVNRHSAWTPKPGGEYSEALVGQPKYINPIFATTNDVDADLSTLIYSGLLRYDEKRQLANDLAESYQISSDGKVYDFILKTGQKFSDGEEITVNDVIYTFELLQNPEVGSPLLAAFQGVRVEKTGDNSVRFTLKTTYAPFLYSLTLGILPEHVWSTISPSSIRLAKFNLQPIGSGPWQFSKMVKDENGNIQTYQLAPNKFYYGEKPYLKLLTFKFFNDYAEVVNALRGETVQAASFIPRSLMNKLSGKRLIEHPLRLPQYTALFFNPELESSLKNDSLRQALQYATDRPKIISEVLDGAGEIIASPILAGQLGYRPVSSTPEFSAEKANQLLDKNWPRIQPEDFYSLERNARLKDYQAEIDTIKKDASSTPEIVSSTLARIEAEIERAIRQEMDSNQEFYRKNNKNQLLQLTIVTAETPEYKKTAELIAQMWRSVGIQTRVRTVDPRQIVRDAIKNRDYQVLLYGEITGADPDPFAFWHSSQTAYPGLNLALFANRNADKIIEDARGTTDPQQRDKLYSKFQSILEDELPAIFLYTPVYNFIASKDVRGISEFPLLSPSQRHADSTRWYVKTSWHWN